VERAGSPADPAGEPPATWRDAFAVPLRPLVADATARLVAAARPVVTPAEVDLDRVAGTFRTWLSRRLVAIATRTFVAHLHELRSGGLLRGADPRARFDDFVTRLARPGGLAGVFARYPVLARLLGQSCDAAVEANLELLTRFAADRADVVAALLDGTEPGPAVAVTAGLGDLHRRGRSVSSVRFADGREVVYRPRDTGTHVWFAELVARLDEAVPGLGLRTVAVVARPGYGWLEHVEHRPVTDPGHVDLFYRRQGALLALLHLVDGADIHCENLIACGDQPVLIDVETVLHPDLPGLGPSRHDPAARALGSSVHRTALLPFPVAGKNGVLDVSGLGGDAGETTQADVVDWEHGGTDRMRLVRRPTTFPGARNRPRLACGPGHDADPVDHEPALQEGFAAAYHAITAHRHAFAALLASRADLEVRVVVRPTEQYAFLLDESTHPALLRNAVDRDLAFGELWRRSAADPVRRRLAGHELADLWDGQVPLFTARSGARDLWAPDGRRIPGVLGRTPVRAALRKLGDLGAADHRDQAWIIAAALATRRRAGRRTGAPVAEHTAVERVPTARASAAARPDDLLAAACAIADEVVARGLVAGDRVNWLGLELVDRRQWAVLPMGGGLDGYLGVALFLAQLSAVSGVARYADTARAAVVAVPDLLDRLGAREDQVGLVGRGGLRGFGGVAYGLARLAVLLGEPGIRSWAGSAVALAARAPDRPGWADGSAGCLAAMTAVHAELGLPSAARLAEECATRTAEVVAEAPEELGDGFADGWAGIAWALDRCAGDPRHAAAARAALTRLAPGESTDARTGPRDAAAARAALARLAPGESSDARTGLRDGAAARAAVARPAAGASSGVGADVGWCGGAAGTVFARVAAGADPGRAATALLTRPVLRDLSLCHGELGVLDALTALAEDTGDTGIAVACRRRAGLVLDAIERYGPSCGTPGWVPTPGLLTGLAGIGYGLLRLGFAGRVPSPLLLRPDVGARKTSGRCVAECSTAQ
jgi:type 2 lantibiotic biosynthesis protein LanM